MNGLTGFGPGEPGGGPGAVTPLESGVDNRMYSQEVVNFLSACKSECDDTWADLKLTMLECYERYRSRRDFSKKKAWQHKIVVPSVYPAIKGASGLVKRILMKTDKFFEFVPERSDSSPQRLDPATGQPAEDLMDNFARAFTKKVSFHLEEASFVDRFEEATESAFTVMLGVLKMTPRRAVDPQVIWAENPNNIDPVTRMPKYEFMLEEKERAKLKIEVVNPIMLRFPHDMAYFIEETRVNLTDLIDNQEKFPWDEEELKRLIDEDYGSAAITDLDRKRRGMMQLKDSTNLYRKEVVLHIFHGDLTNKKGELVLPRCRFIVANEKYLLLPPEPVPYWLRKHPYVIFTPLKILFSVVGAGMIDGIRPLINALDSLYNIAGDRALFALLPPTEVNVSSLEDKTQLEGGLTPGKTLRTTGPLGRVMYQVPGGDIPRGVFALGETFRGFVQNYTGWTDFIQGMPSRKDVTATEVERKTEASSIAFENIAASIERGGVIESIELARDLTVQYFLDPILNPETLDIFIQEGIDLNALPPAQRFAFINRRYPIKCKGLVAFFDKEKIRRDLIEIAEVLSKFPALAQYLNGIGFMKRLFTTYDIPTPEDLIVGAPMLPRDPKTGEPVPPAGNDPTTGRPVSQEEAAFSERISAGGGGGNLTMEQLMARAVGEPGGGMPVAA